MADGEQGMGVAVADADREALTKLRGWVETLGLDDEADVPGSSSEWVRAGEALDRLLKVEAPTTVLPDEALDGIAFRICGDPLYDVEWDRLEAGEREQVRVGLRAALGRDASTGERPEPCPDCVLGVKVEWRTHDHVPQGPPCPTCGGTGERPERRATASELDERARAAGVPLRRQQSGDDTRSAWSCFKCGYYNGPDYKTCFRCEVLAAEEAGERDASPPGPQPVPLAPGHMGAPSEEECQAMFTTLAVMDVLADATGDRTALEQFEAQLPVPARRLRELGQRRLDAGKWWPPKTPHLRVVGDASPPELRDEYVPLGEIREGDVLRVTVSGDFEHDTWDESRPVECVESDGESITLTLRDPEDDRVYTWTKPADHRVTRRAQSPASPPDRQGEGERPSWAVAKQERDDAYKARDEAVARAERAEASYTGLWRERAEEAERERDELVAAIDAALETTWTRDDEGGWGEESGGGESGERSYDQRHPDRLSALAGLQPHWQAWGDQAWDTAGRDAEKRRKAEGEVGRLKGELATMRAVGPDLLLRVLRNPPPGFVTVMASHGVHQRVLGTLADQLADYVGVPATALTHNPACDPPFVAFVGAMAGELAANAGKGDRRGWLEMDHREAVGEVLYHAAKLAYAARQHAQGDGPPEKVREFAADVANCAMMVADVAGVLAPRAERKPDYRCTRCGTDIFGNPRFCPKCDYTVYQRIHHDEPASAADEGAEAS